MAANLRAVSGDKRPNRSRSVVEAAKGGDQLDLLIAMRDRIATAVSNPDCPPRDLASLTRRLQDIVKDIAGLQAQKPSRSTPAGSTDESFDPSAV